MKEYVTTSVSGTTKEAGEIRDKGLKPQTIFLIWYRLYEYAPDVSSTLVAYIPLAILGHQTLNHLPLLRGLFFLLYCVIVYAFYERISVHQEILEPNFIACAVALLGAWCVERLRQKN